jgi:2-C-methyl-D-erythritol 4-phosphate cytidylyltransferase
MSLSAVIVAGGSGKRFGSKKQFLELKGIPVLKRAASCFIAQPLVDRIVVVVPEEDLTQAQKLFSGMGKKLIIAKGGRTRQESTLNGLRITQKSTTVLIHDGVRPFVSSSLIMRVIEGLAGYDACIPAIEVSDTLKEVREGIIVKTIPRQGLYQVQTPQAFRTEALMAAHEAVLQEGILDLTDDSALMEKAGRTMRIVQGDPLNIKITFKDDISLAEAILSCHTVLG